MKRILTAMVIGILCFSMLTLLAMKVQAAFTLPTYDEQFGLAFDGNFTSLSYNVWYIKMQDGAGIGPAYLLNGLTDQGYWYQVGVCYRWPTGFDTTESGFIYQVWDPNPNDNSLSGDLFGGATVLDFAGSVINGDVFKLTLSFQAGQVLMEAYDTTTGAYASATWDAYGATQFVGGYRPGFTGLMTEWYHTEEWVGNIPNGVPYWENVGQAGSLTGGTMFIDEFHLHLTSSLHLQKDPLFAFDDHVSYTGNNLHFIDYEGGTVYSKSDFFITGPDKTDQVTFSYSVQGGGSPEAPILVYAYQAQPHLITLSTTPQTYTVDDLTLWSAHNSYGLGSERWVTNPDSGIAVSGVVNIVYYHQFLETLSYSVVGGGSPSPPRWAANQFGQPYRQTLTFDPTGYWFDAGSSWSVTNPLGEPAVSIYLEHWVLNQSPEPLSGTVSTAASIAFVYIHQYALTTWLPYGGNPLNGGWYDAGSVVDVSANAPPASSGYQYRWNGWVGIGDGSYTGMNVSATVTMNGFITETAYWTAQCYLTLATNPPNVTVPTGQGWFDAGSSAAISTDQNVAIAAGSSRYSFTGWTTSNMTEIANPTSQSTTVIIDEAKTVTANYITQYNVTFSQTGVGLDFTGTVVTIDGIDYDVNSFPISFWWDDSSTHTFVFQSPLVNPSGAGQYNWSSTTGLSTQQSDSITVIGSGTVTGNYVSRVHDVAVTNITVHTIYNHTYVYQGTPANITVTVWNNGNFPENVAVTLYYNITANEIVGTQNISLLAGENGTLLFVWNTKGVTPCYTNYTLTAVATIPIDYTPADNTLTGGNIAVRLMGDLTGTGTVDMNDVGIAAAAFGSHPGTSKWNPAADVNGDGIIDLRDIALIAQHFGQHYP